LITVVTIGLVLTAAAVLSLLLLSLRGPQRGAFPPYGFAGLLLIAGAEILLFAGIPIIATFFTPLCWTGYILVVDAAVFRARGRSLLRSEPQAFVWMAVLSIFLWLIFEAFNLVLTNWLYVGLPSNDFVRYFGYGWSFATIWPAVLETADFLLATLFPRSGPPPEPPEPRRHTTGWIWIGAALVALPLIAPDDLQIYLFGAVWLGFILLIDPLNYRARRPSLWGDLAHGYRPRFWALLLAGSSCGILWEFWNYWASAKWLYLFPILAEYRVFEMPVIGYLGFPAFALEIFALYVFASSALSVESYPLG
jgi:hypothetical protein